MPVLLALALNERRRYGSRGPRSRWLAWLAGVFFAADLILWHHSIAAVGAGLATVLGNVQVVIVPIAAWFLLSERPGARVVAAVPVVLIGVVLISGVVGEGAYGDDPALGVLFGILTAACVRRLPAGAAREFADVRARPGRSSTRRSPPRSSLCRWGGCSESSSRTSWESFCGSSCSRSPRRCSAGC